MRNKWIHNCISLTWLQWVCAQLRPHGKLPASLLCLWDFPGKNTGVGCHFLLQGIFLTHESNPCLLTWQADSLLSEPPGKPHHSHCYCSVTKSCLTLCNPVDCSTPCFAILHYLPEFSQTHIHRVGDAIQPSTPLSSPSPPAFNLSQHQGLF